jgi:poly-gamma-glutamate system protein
VLNLLHNRTYGLVIILIISFLSIYILEKYFVERKERPDKAQMLEAGRLTKGWFELVEMEKSRKGIYNANGADIKYYGLLGSEYSEITTTLGSLDAKETVLNPDFSALVVRLLHDAGIDSNGIVGVNLSGSFPSLAIAVFAAIQTIKARAVVISSLGSSTYGANQPGATWIDIEHWLCEKGGSEIKSSMVTLGAEGDSGGGLSEDGVKILKNTANKYGVNLFIPKSLRETIDQRVKLYKESKITILVNIGGNQASLGNCAHSLTIPNGYHAYFQSCSDYERGIIMRLAEDGIPFIHFLYLKDLAIKYGLPIISSNGNYDGSRLYQKYYIQKGPCVVAFVLIAFLLFINHKYQ